MIIKRKTYSTKFNFDNVYGGGVFGAASGVISGLLTESDDKPKHVIKSGVLGAGVGVAAGALISLPEYIKNVKAEKNNASKQITFETAKTLDGMLPYEYYKVKSIMEDLETQRLAKKIKDTHELWDNTLGIFSEDVIRNGKDQVRNIFAIGHKYGFGFDFNTNGWFLIPNYAYPNKERPIPIGLSPKKTIIDTLNDLISSCEDRDISNYLAHQLKLVTKNL